MEKIGTKAILYKEVEELDNQYWQVLYDNDIVTKSHLTMSDLGGRLAYAVEDAEEISQNLYETVITRIAEIKQLAEDLIKYGRGTKFSYLTNTLGRVDNVASILQGSYGDSIDRMVSLHERYIPKSIQSDNRELIEYYGQFNLESKEDVMDCHELKMGILTHYELTTTIVKLITLTMAITLDKELKRSRRKFDIAAVSNKYSQLYGLKRPPVLASNESMAYRILIQIGRWTLLDILKHDFRDTSNWPFRDNLPELLYEKTLGYTLTGVKMHKLSMIGANEFKGITLKECVYMSTLRELLNKLIK